MGQRAILIPVITATMLAGCGIVATPSLTTASSTETQAVEATAAPTEPPTEEVASAPQTIRFTLTDGSEIVGTYYPPRVTPAPGALLVHQMGMDRQAWEPLIQGLQRELSRSLTSRLAETPNYAVLAVDLPGHGESGGQPTDQNILEATRLAFQALRQMPGVDGDRLVIIGASVGADAAVDECKDGCIGAVSLSPGSYVGVDYVTALQALGDRPALCIAAKDDFPSAATCESGKSAGLANYQTQIYDGGAHGNMLILQNAEMSPPQPLPLILEWMAINAPLGS